MRKSEIAVLAALMLVALSGFLYSHKLGLAKQELTKREPPLSMTSKELLANSHDFFGDKTAPYTLVEFGDYQCPPCRASRKSVEETLVKYKGKLKLDFRNLPLVSIHPFAMHSAVVAENARLEMRFWEVHSLLFQANLSDATIEKIVKEHIKERKLSPQMLSKGRKIVEADMELAQRLSVNGTPTFLLCCPDGRVLKLASIENVKDYLTM